MDFQVTFRVNEKMYLKDPESSEIGRAIVKMGIDLIYELGFENFTFKKLAREIETTEATVYRYFENKHRLLLYILNWYWSYMEFLVMFRLQNIKDTRTQLITIVHLLTHDLPESSGTLDYNRKHLNQIVISESSKAYLIKEVNAINKEQAFKPYKDLCAKIADVVAAHAPKYKYPRSLSSTLIETAHNQQYFSNHLPRLTDAEPKNRSEFTAKFLQDMIFRILD